MHYLINRRLGHFTYECKGSRPYISRPSRTQQLENPRALSKLKADGKPSVDVPEEFKNKYAHSNVVDYVERKLSILCRSGTANRILEAKEKERAKDPEGGKKKRSRYVILCRAPFNPALTVIFQVFFRLRLV